MAQCAKFIIGPAKGRTRWLIAPYGPSYQRVSFHGRFQLAIIVRRARSYGYWGCLLAKMTDPGVNSRIKPGTRVTCKRRSASPERALNRMTPAQLFGRRGAPQNKSEPPLSST